MLFIVPALLLMALLAYIKPKRAVVLLVALLPVYLIKFSVISLPTNLFEASVIVVAVVLALQSRVRTKWSLASKAVPPWFFATVALLALAALVSAFISPHPRTSFGILKGWVILPMIVGWLVYASSVGASGHSFAARIARSLITSGLIVSIIGLAQVGRLERARSVFTVSNSLALFLVPLLALAFYFIVIGYSKAFYWPAAVVMAVAIVATRSATGATAALFALIGAVVINRWTGHQTSRAAASFIVLFLLVATGGLYVSGRLAYLARPWLGESGGHNSILVRAQLWSVGLELWRARPWFGVGLGEFEPAYQQKLHQRFASYNHCRFNPLVPPQDCRPPLAEFVYRDPHNWPLSFGLNTGLVGLASFVVINGGLAARVIAKTKPTKKTNRSAVDQVRVAAGLALAATLLLGLVETIYWKNDLAALYWILVGLLLS